MKTPNSDIGTVFADLRAKHALSQDQVAHHLGISRQTYAQIEKSQQEPSLGELQKLADLFGLNLSDLFQQPGNSAKFRQMYFYVLRFFGSAGVPKTKLAKLLYLADFTNYYHQLQPMSGMRYVRRQYGPLADGFLDLTDELYDSGKITIDLLGSAFMVKNNSREHDFDLLTEADQALLTKICRAWQDKTTAQIVNFTHEQKPWKSCLDGEYIPYSLIIQEDPKHVYQPVA